MPLTENYKLDHSGGYDQCYAPVPVKKNKNKEIDDNSADSSAKKVQKNRKTDSAIGLEPAIN